MFRSLGLGLAGFCALIAQPKLSGPQPELVSLLGKTFFAQKDDTGEIRKADTALARNPSNVELLLAAGQARDQRLQFHGAIEMYTRAITAAPADPRAYRFRGHRYISIRRFDEAVRDLAAAARLAPASYDVAYHLGLALYLRGDFQQAADEYERCMSQTQTSGQLPPGWRSCASLSSDADSRVAITDWRYRALRRAGGHEEARRVIAAFDPGVEVKENGAYLQALRIYKGLVRQVDLAPSRMSGNDHATLGYAVGNLYLVEGRPPEACTLFRRVADSDLWNAFGFIAAEVELSRSRGPCSR
jgi:tetratricopeptide (TPR) repeat protein